MPRQLSGVCPGSMLTGLEAVKLAKLTEINAAFDAAAARLTDTYPERELLTFDQQVSEATAYLADKAKPCPMLMSLAEARGIDLEDLCNRVLAKHQAFSIATGNLMGQRQAQEDALDACTTPEQVQAIAVAYILPG